ncbi:MAG: hypothetical protein HOU81_16830 [Hamadaea sp.]|uniref:hypothetical protein n=1 Tax=Hamadaea sp. TaxID=2024425 RepID=UPI00184F735D|nr:hypothetical protein [Hamadaea sp.]NUR72482.1 hypothetical protein [Hamadaea sp.]NUT17775.1 hypothetical protein [Hamadaea sp.]
MSLINQSDLDLLADYVGGALDGTPEAAEVGERIRTDIAWAAAHAELVAATDDVQGRLQDLGAVPEAMPEDVWGRLEAALLAEPPIGAPDPDAPVRPIDNRPADNRPAGRASRRRRIWAPVLVGLAVLAALGIGISALRPLTDSGSDTAGTGLTASAPDAAGLAAARFATGRDYSATTLVLATDFGNANTLASRQPTTSGGNSEKAASAPAPFSSFASPVPDALSRLLDEPTLSRCLYLLRQTGLPGDVVGVDYARYAGSPALIVVTRTVDDARWVAVAGPDCGTGADADLVLSKRVG